MGWKNPTIGRRIEDPKYSMDIRIEAAAERDGPVCTVYSWIPAGFVFRLLTRPRSVLLDHQI